MKAFTMKAFTRIVVFIPFLISVFACDRQAVIPEQLEGKVDRKLQFSDVKQDPHSYRGKLILVGGKVLSAKRLKEGTRIEVLQMPLSWDFVPDETRQESHGRFLAIDFEKKIADPAMLEDDELITVVGEVLGSETVTIDETRQQVPKLSAKQVTIWQKDRSRTLYYGRAM